MPTKETQALILNTAIELFNKYGSNRVSTNRIADACKISKGNLNYHFRTKESIIQSIYALIVKEMQEQWHDEFEQPTVRHMSAMFSRQLDLISRYRFFYRELTPLLQNDPVLKATFAKTRANRRKIVTRFFTGLINQGVLAPPKDERTLPSLITIGWILSDYWISYIAIDDQEIDQDSIQQGYALMVELFKPYLTASALAEIEKELYATSPNS